jgi:hypothetical protein
MRELIVAEFITLDGVIQAPASPLPTGVVFMRYRRTA